MNVNANQPGNRDDGATGSAISMDIRHLSVEQFARLGVSEIAYVRAVTMSGEQGFAIHAADGTPMAMASDRDVAIAAIIQHEMVPALVH